MSTETVIDVALTKDQTMASSLNTQIIRDTVLDAALALANDPIPNIRFNVAKCLETLAGVMAASPEGQEITQRKIMPALKKLQEDSDADVRSVWARRFHRRIACAAAVANTTDTVHRFFATKALDRTSGDEFRAGEPMGTSILNPGHCTSLMMAVLS